MLIKMSIKVKTFVTNKRATSDSKLLYLNKLKYQNTTYIILVYVAMCITPNI